MLHPEGFFHKLLAEAPQPVVVSVAFLPQHGQALLGVARDARLALKQIIATEQGDQANAHQHRMVVKRFNQVGELLHCTTSSVVSVTLAGGGGTTGKFRRDLC